MRTELKGICVQLVVADVLIERAVELIGAALGDDVDYSASSSANVGRVVIGQHANFADGVDGGTDTDGSDETLVVIQTVDQIVINDVGLSVRRDRRALSAVVRTVA